MLNATGSEFGRIAARRVREGPGGFAARFRDAGPLTAWLRPVIRNGQFVAKTTAGPPPLRGPAAYFGRLHPAAAGHTAILAPGFKDSSFPAFHRFQSFIVSKIPSFHRSQVPERPP